MILKSIKYRDNLYKNLQLLSPESARYQLAGVTLKTYDYIQNRRIRFAKKTFYTAELDKYKNDIRKTWDTLKTILNKAKIKSDFPKFLLINGKQETDM